MPINDPTGPLAKAFVTAIRSAETAVGDRFYSPVPEKREYPYGNVGEIQVINELIEDFSGAEIYLTIHGWSQKNSKQEIYTIGRQFIAALDEADLSNGELTVNSCLLQDANYLDDPDGKTSHVALTFHILTD